MKNWHFWSKLIINTSLSSRFFINITLLCLIEIKTTPNNPPNFITSFTIPLTSYKKFIKNIDLLENLIYILQSWYKGIIFMSGRVDRKPIKCQNTSLNISPLFYFKSFCRILEDYCLTFITWLNLSSCFEDLFAAFFILLFLFSSSSWFLFFDFLHHVLQIETFNSCTGLYKRQYSFESALLILILIQV